MDTYCKEHASYANYSYECKASLLRKTTKRINAFLMEYFPKFYSTCFQDCVMLNNHTNFNFAGLTFIINYESKTMSVSDSASLNTESSIISKEDELALYLECYFEVYK